MELYLRFEVPGFVNTQFEKLENLQIPNYYPENSDTFWLQGKLYQVPTYAEGYYNADVGLYDGEEFVKLA